MPYCLIDWIDWILNQADVKNPAYAKYGKKNMQKGKILYDALSTQGEKRATA